MFSSHIYKISPQTLVFQPPSKDVKQILFVDFMCNEIIEEAQIAVIPAEKNLQKRYLQWFDGNVPIRVLTFCGVWFDGALSVNVSDFFVVYDHPVHIDLVVQRVILCDNVGHATKKR